MPTASTCTLVLLFLATLSAQTIQPGTIFRIQPAESTRRLVSVDSSGQELLFSFADSRATELVRTDLAGTEQARCTVPGGSREALFTPQRQTILISRFGAVVSELSPECQVVRNAKFSQKYAHLLIDGSDALGVMGEAILSLDLSTGQPGPVTPFPSLGDDPAYFVRTAPGIIAVVHIGTGRTAFVNRRDPPPRVHQCLDPAVLKRSEQLDAHELLFAPAVGSWYGSVLLVLSGFRAQDGAPLYALGPDGNCTKLALLKVPDLPALVKAPTSNRPSSNPRGELSIDALVATANALLLIDRGSGFVAKYSAEELRRHE
ncbi:MAG: hypothetical protein J0H49_37610 [Acidobacteria bacterium]|nr:hypothetical protein [Acidobacteriota bacterium]